MTDLAREQATFVKYEDGKLWYQIIWVDDNHPLGGPDGRTVLFDFPIDVNDAGGGAFGHVEKGLYLMRWIRKHLEYLKAAQSEAKEP